VNTMATKKMMNPFKGPETKKNESAEKKMTKGNPKAYAKMEAKYEKYSDTGKPMGMAKVKKMK